MSSIIDSLAKLAEKFSQKYPGEVSGVATLDGSGDVVEAVTSIQADAVAATGGSDTHKQMGMIHVDGTQDVYSGAGALAGYTLPADTLDVNGKSIRVKWWGTHSGTTGTANISIVWGGFTILTASFTNAAVDHWVAELHVIRRGAAAQTVVGEIRTYDNVGMQIADSQLISSADTEDLTTNTVLDITIGTITGDGAGTQEGMIVELLN